MLQLHKIQSIFGKSYDVEHFTIFFCCMSPWWPKVALLTFALMSPKRAPSGRGGALESGPRVTNLVLLRQASCSPSHTWSRSWQCLRWDYERWQWGWAIFLLHMTQCKPFRFIFKWWNYHTLLIVARVRSALASISTIFVKYRILLNFPLQLGWSQMVHCNFRHKWVLLTKPFQQAQIFADQHKQSQ